MLKGVARKRLLEFVLVTFLYYMAMQVARSRRAHQSTGWHCVQCGLVEVSERDLVRCASSGHYRRVRWGRSLLEWSLELYMHQTPLPKGLRPVVLLFWMPVLMALTFGKGHIRPSSFGLFPCVVLCLYV